MPRRTAWFRSGAFRVTSSVAALALACSGAVDDRTSAVPVNDCSEHDCSAYLQPQTAVCQEGRCILNIEFDDNYFVVVSAPDTEPTFPGYSVALTPIELESAAARLSCPVAHCGAIPGLTLVSGAFTVTPSEERAVGRNLRGAAGERTSVPSHAEYLPLAPLLPGSTVQGVLAADLALPMPSLFGRAVLGAELPLPPTVDGGGPGESLVTGWVASLPGGGGESYLGYVTPDPPFDDAFPPLFQTITLGQRQQAEDFRTLLSLDPVGPQTFKISSDGQTLDGWTVALYDRQTQQRISSMRVLGDAPSTVVLNTALNGRQPKKEIVIAPPAGVVAPELGFPDVPSIPLTLTYPKINPVRHVSGRVLGAASGVPVTADLIFRSTDPLTSSVPNTPIRYRATVATDATGTFAVDLFEGKYEVAVITASDSPYASALLSSFVVSQDDVQSGKSLSIPLLGRIEGRVELSDHRPLASAEVVATPIPVDFDPDRPLARFGRVSRVTSADDGSYSIPVDPGIVYDVSIRPRDGSRYPWMVATSLPDRASPIVVADQPLRLATITVPLPIDAGRTLLNQTGNPLRGARVRAYYTVPGRRSPVQIAEVSTDSAGNYEMYLAQPLQ